MMFIGRGRKHQAIINPPRDIRSPKEPSLENVDTDRAKKHHATASPTRNFRSPKQVSLEKVDADHLAGQFQSSELFRIIVGPEGTEYHLHKNTLIDRSPYFASLHSFGGVETTENTVTLLDIPVRAFKVFITFIYGNVYHIPTNLSHNDAFVLHAEVYILADRMCMTDLQRLAFNMVKQGVKGGDLGFDYIESVLEYVYENTPDRDTDEDEVVITEPGSTQAIRTLLVKLCCYNLGELMSRDVLPNVLRSHGELAVDMLRRLKDLEKADINYDRD